MTRLPNSEFSPRTVALIGRFKTPALAEPLGCLAKHLQQRGMTVLFEQETAQDIGSRIDLSPWETCRFRDIGEHADLAIVVGGDGTMLNAARRLARHRVPLIGVNQGHLGFLTDIPRDEMLQNIDAILDGNFKPEHRMLLEAEVFRCDHPVISHLAMNDVVVDKGDRGRLIDLDLFIDGELVCDLRADGLILATPTGSTAYALSAGGPILHPASTGIAVVPLNPHTLSNRPIIISDCAEIEIRILSGEATRVHFDGRNTVHLQAGDCLRVRRSGQSVCFLHPQTYSYFATLRQKLQWNEHPGNN